MSIDVTGLETLFKVLLDRSHIGWANLSLSYNRHATDVDGELTVKQADSTYYQHVEWVSEAEHERALELNIIWEIEYGSSSVGYDCIAASSLQPLIDYLQRDREPEYNAETVAKILKAREGPFETVPADSVEFRKWLESE